MTTEQNRPGSSAAPALPTREQALERLTGPGGDFELTTAEDGHQPPLRVYARGPASLREVLLASRAYGDREFLIYEDERITYADFHQRVAGLAHWLHDTAAVAKGDRVAIGMRNYPEWAISFFACQAIGAVAVTLNAWWTGGELVYGLTDSGSKVAIVDDERLARLTSHRSELAGLQLLVTRNGPIEPAHDSWIQSWPDALAKYAHVTDLPQLEVGPLDIATIMYTSGTTGFPKGALHTHRNHVTNLLNTLLAGAVARAQLPPAPPDAPAPPQGVGLQTFPLFHIGGLSGLYVNLANGAKIVLMYKWDAGQAIDLIERERVMGWSAVPTLVRQLVEHPRARSGALDSIVGISSGGAPVPPDLIKQIGSQFAARVAPGNGYGATETTSAVIANGGADYLARPDSVGRPAVTVDVRIVDDDGHDCETGSMGELWIRGPNVFVGYWNKPAETAAASADGWFKTGDLGCRDADGFYHVVDRKKDVIIRGGENVYSAEVEHVLHEHPDIVDCALIGLPHRTLGEEVAVVVEAKRGASITAEDVQAHVAARLARFNVPTKVFFIDEPLPRTATGKILKRELKQRYG
jgi:long-chain acyl-CoA synthetase